MSNANSSTGDGPDIKLFDLFEGFACVVLAQNLVGEILYDDNSKYLNNICIQELCEKLETLRGSNLIRYQAMSNLCESNLGESNLSINSPPRASPHRNLSMGQHNISVLQLRRAVPIHNLNSLSTDQLNQLMNSSGLPNPGALRRAEGLQNLNLSNDQQNSLPTDQLNQLMNLSGSRNPGALRRAEGLQNLNLSNDQQNSYSAPGGGFGSRSLDNPAIILINSSDLARTI